MLGVKSRNRPTLGLLISQFDGSYQRLLWQGLHDFCEQHDCDLVIFASRLWRGMSGDPRAQESIYRLADKSRIDGLGIDSSAFNSETECAEFLAANKSLSGIPLVQVSLRLPGKTLPAILPDNREGIRQVVAHLADVHGCHRLAYIGGPSGISMAGQRLEAILEICRERGLQLPSGHLREGGFDAPSGRLATLSILDAPLPLPEAIIYANDHMAMGGLTALAERGLRVPADIRVFGFDDCNLAAYTSPPLATVHQPIYQEGWQTGATLLQAIDGLPIPGEQTMPVSLVPRSSCGCDEGQTPASQGQTPTANGGMQRLIEAQNTIFSIKTITDYVATVLSLPNLAQEFAKVLPLVKHGTAYLALFDTETQTDWNPSQYAHLIASADSQGKLLVDPANPRRFLSRQLVPAYLMPTDQRHTLIVQSLLKEPRNFGFIVHDYRGEDPAILEALRDQASAALFNIALVDEENAQRAALNAALVRAEESERRYRELALFLPTILMETDEQGRIVFLNNLGTETLELSGPELESKPRLAEFVATESELTQILASESPKSYRQLHLKTRAGRQKTLLVKTAPDPKNPARIRWNGIDFKPILNSLAIPDANIFDEYALTAREKEILALELAGLIGKEIASHLSLSLSTVKAHIGSIYRKIGVSSRDQLFGRVRERLVGAYGFDSLVFSLMSQLLHE